MSSILAESDSIQYKMVWQPIKVTKHYKTKKIDIIKKKKTCQDCIHYKLSQTNEEKHIGGLKSWLWI